MLIIFQNWYITVARLEIEAVYGSMTDRNITIYTTGAAHWGDDDILSAEWQPTGATYRHVIPELQKYYTTITINHYDPLYAPQSTTVLDDVTVNHYVRALDPNTLAPGTLVYDYAHILNPIIVDGELCMLIQDNYTDHPLISNTVDLKVVYRPDHSMWERTVSHQQHMSVNSHTGDITTLYDRLHHHRLPMNGTYNWKDIVAPMIGAQKAIEYADINKTMTGGSERLAALDAADERIPKIIVESL
jgi:hypothetical protein